MFPIRKISPTLAYIYQQGPLENYSQPVLKKLVSLDSVAFFLKTGLVFP